MNEKPWFKKTKEYHVENITILFIYSASYAPSWLVNLRTQMMQVREHELWMLSFPFKHFISVISLCSRSVL